jgi:polyhydroxyalkanoate synthesis regulator phasin
MMVSEVIKKAMLAGVGAQEKAKEFIDELVKAGELSKSEAASVVKEWAAKAEESRKDMDHKVKDAIAAAFEKINIATRDDLAGLEKKVQGLAARISKLEGGDGKGED